MEYLIDIRSSSLTKHGEILCGDQVKQRAAKGQTFVVLSDGLGSGVKANILATLTCEIIASMLSQGAELGHVVETVIGTLPVDKVRNSAYATFTAVRIDQSTGAFQVVNFDNPPVMYFRLGKLRPLNDETVSVAGRRVTLSEGTLQRGDLLAMMSDGVPHAGIGNALSFGWGWQNIADHIERRFLTHYRTALDVVRDIAAVTGRLYGGRPGDDATVVGVYARRRRRLLLFTGPPLDESLDAGIADRLLSFDGTRVVCGGTSGSIVATAVGGEIETDLSTMREDVPPIGILYGVDLLTEGLITMSKAMEYLRACDGNPSGLPRDRNGAVMLATELLQADDIEMIVGQQINPFYQNPLLPRSISLRKNLIREMSDFLRDHGKQVTVEFC